MNWLDLGIIIFIIIFIVIGIKQGLMSSVLSNFSFTINCLCSFFLYKPIMWINNVLFHLGDKIYNSYYTQMLARDSESLTHALTTDLINVNSVQPENLKNIVDTAINDSKLSFIPKTMFKIFFKNKKNLAELLSVHESRTAAEVISQTFATFFGTIIAFGISILLCYLIIFLFKKLAEKLRTIGFVKFVDDSFGAVYGLFKCFLVLIAICFVVNLLSTFTFMNGVINYIDASLFGKFIYARITEFTNHYLSLSDIISSIF